jgi:methionyl aminopeptidase
MLVNAINAANVHKKVGNSIREYIKPNMKLKDIVIYIENEIKKETNFDNNKPTEKGIAFPTGLSMNNCAAHYTPNYNETDLFFTENDILKIDYGVHFQGTIIDSAFTISFNPKYDEFINISKNLTNYAVSLCKPDAILGEIGKNIEEYVKSKEIEIDGKIYPIEIMRDLSGHRISKYEIHAGKAVPNINIDYNLRMYEGEYYAIEPFITTGNGKSLLKEPNSHYMLNRNHSNIKLYNKNEQNLYKIINKNYSTLPFCQRWLYEMDSLLEHDISLKNLVNKKVLNVYPPIYDIDNSIISQFEHTIYIKGNGIINLTKNNYY